MDNQKRENLKKTYIRMLQQERFVQASVEISDEYGLYDDLGKDINDTCGQIEIDDVDNIIDKYEDDVKWLEKNLAIIENRFAYSVKKIIDADESQMMHLKDAFYKMGAEVNPEYEGKPVIEIYWVIRNLLLDGGKSEEFNKIVDDTYDEVVWTRTRPTTMKYWTYWDLDFHKYYTELRRAFIKGILEKTDIEFVVIEENVISLARR